MAFLCARDGVAIVGNARGAKARESRSLRSISGVDRRHAAVLPDHCHSSPIAREHVSLLPRSASIELAPCQALAVLRQDGDDHRTPAATEVVRRRGHRIDRKQPPTGQHRAGAEPHPVPVRNLAGHFIELRGSIEDADLVGVRARHDQAIVGSGAGDRMGIPAVRNGVLGELPGVALRVEPIEGQGFLRALLKGRARGAGPRQRAGPADRHLRALLGAKHFRGWRAEGLAVVGRCTARTGPRLA